MKLEITFLHSRLARRIFWLFVLCAIVPITVLAFVSLRNVTAQLDEQSHKQLHQAAREEAMIVYERLSFLEADLKLVSFAMRDGSANAMGLSSHLESRLSGLELLTPDGKRQSLFGKNRLRIEHAEAEQKALQSGKNVLSTFPCDDGDRCIFLSRELDPQHSDRGILVAQVNASYLWDVENLPPGSNVCVLEQSGQTLFCEGESPASFPAQVTQHFSGQFEWKLNGREWIGHFWNLPLETGFSVPHWTIVSSKAKPDVLAPLARFKTSFLLVYLLALWIVVLLSLVQIRRNLIPLAKLKEGTSQLSRGNFHARVEVKSGDEFQELAASFNSMANRIEKQVNSLKVFNEVDRAILSAWDIQKIVDTLSGRIGELIPLDLVSICLFEGEQSSSAITHLYGPILRDGRNEEIVSVTADERRELFAREGVWVLDASGTPPNYVRPMVGRGMKHFLVVPIVVDGQLAAGLTIAHATKYSWTADDKEHARKLGDQLGVALANAHLISQLHQLQWGSLTALARAIDAKSPWTMGHSERVTEFAIKLGEAMGLGLKELEVMRRGGLLHDIGKIGIPVSILDKPGKLTDEEIRIMREHVNIGARILEPIPGLSDSMPIVLQHHEWINGRGYPNGLAGEEVTLHARIFAVADCFDALISDRPYRPGLSIERAKQIIQEGAGKQFDPSVVDTFERIVDQLNTRLERETPAGEMAEVT